MDFNDETIRSMRLEELVSRLASINGEESFEDEAIVINEEIVSRVGLDDSSKYLIAIDSLLALGEIFTKQENFSSAVKYKEKALRVQISHCPAQSYQEQVQIVEFLHNLGWLSRQAGELDQAELFYTEATQLVQSMVGTDHPDYALGLVKCAEVQHEKGDMNTTVALLEDAVGMLEAYLGPIHQSTAQAKSFLASSLRLQSKLAYERSQVLMQEALNGQCQDDIAWQHLEISPSARSSARTNISDWSGETIFGVHGQLSGKLT